ncbi:MAG: molybdopterin synthase sulfur carrier subunit [Catenulispora sp.]|nr:molybdopterin synthase sulfur carrier subunit [Catenulispora sp.]
MTVTIRVPAALAAHSGGRREVLVTAAAPTTVAGLLDRLAAELPALERRIRDERGSIRRHVNLYVDGEDIRSLSGTETAVPENADVTVMAAISGG